MDKVLIVEVRNRRDELVERHQLKQLPVFVGRGYANDIVIDDPYICPEHVRISPSDNGLIVEDLKSVNGMFDEVSATSAASLHPAHGTRIRIGTSVLQFVDPETPIAPAVPLTIRRSTRIRSWHAISAVACCLSLITLQSYWFDYSADPRPLLTAFTEALILAFLFWAPWAGIWTLIGRVVQQRARFAAHLTIVALGTYILALSDLGATYAAFAFGSTSLGNLLNVGLAAIAGITLLHLHLRWATPLAIKHIHFLSTATLGAILGLTLLYASVKAPAFSTKLPLQKTLKPLSFKAVDSLSIETFAVQTSELERKLQRDIKKSVNP